MKSDLVPPIQTGAPLSKLAPPLSKLAPPIQTGAPLSKLEPPFPNWRPLSIEHGRVKSCCHAKLRENSNYLGVIHWRKFQWNSNRYSNGTASITEDTKPITTHGHLIERTPVPIIECLVLIPGPLTMLAVPLKLPTPDSGILDLENFAQV